MHLALDHLTVTDAYPWQLADLAARHGYQGCCLFMSSMNVLPHMPAFDLTNDKQTLQRTRSALADNAISLDLAYPFTLTGRSRIQDFLPALDTAHTLGACAANLLVYDRDEARRIDSIGQLADQARQRGIELVLEFFPASAVGSLTCARQLVEDLGHDNLSVNLDLLHLYRSGGDPKYFAACADSVGFIQVADGLLEEPVSRDREASSERLLPGEGEFDIQVAIKAASRGTKISLEIPRDTAIAAGVSMDERARTAINRFKTLLEN